MSSRSTRLPNQTIPATTNTSNPSIFSTILNGFAWGTGTSIARRIFENPSQSNQPVQSNHQVHPVQPRPDLNFSEEIFKKYQECLENKEYSFTDCDSILISNFK